MRVAEPIKVDYDLEVGVAPAFQERVEMSAIFVPRKPAAAA